MEKIRSNLVECLESGRGSSLNSIVAEVQKKIQECWGNGLDPINEHKTRGPRQRVKGFQPAHLFAAFLDPRSKALKVFDSVSQATVHQMVKDEMKTFAEVSSTIMKSASNTRYRASNIVDIFDDSDEDELVHAATSVDNEL